MRAALGVVDREPSTADRPPRSAPNVTPAPHLGCGRDALFNQFYGESLENIEAFLAGRPIRVMNPEALPK